MYLTESATVFKECTDNVSYVFIKLDKKKNKIKLVLTRSDDQLIYEITEGKTGLKLEREVHEYEG